MISPPAGSEGEQVAYVEHALSDGHVTFCGVDLQVAPGTLIPRPETEILARAAIGLLGAVSGEARVIDMCCGAANLACAIAHHVGARVWGCDSLPEAIALARTNATRIDGSRVTIAEGDLFSALAGEGLEGSIDAIVCNPPYISSRRLEHDRAFLLEHEPRAAFDGGPYGLSIYQRVLKEAGPFLRPGGWLMFEVGVGQDRPVSLLFQRHPEYTDLDRRSDDEGNVRVVLGKKV
jgi:release factor glutamine methyltransferase